MRPDPQNINTPSSSVLDVTHLCLTLPSLAGPIEILRDVSVQVAARETIAITGASGSGKSSLMAVLCGLERATSGRVHVAGLDFSALDEDALARARRGRIGIVLQAFHLLPTLTALENVSVPLELGGEKNAAAIAAEELRSVGLGHRLDHYPSQLSGGEQQRVAIARALAGKPPLLFADEPTGNLDAATGAQIIDLLFNLHAERGTTLVLITHDPALAAKCGRTLRMVDGKIAADTVNGAQRAELPAHG